MRQNIGIFNPMNGLGVHSKNPCQARTGAFYYLLTRKLLMSGTAAPLKEQKLVWHFIVKSM
jgi:hypothetical protein